VRTNTTEPAVPVPLGNPAMRFDVLDCWRGIAALMVAIFHFNALHHGFYLPLLRNSFFFVDFFFVLSGFVIAHAYAGRLSTMAEATVFAVKRFGRVWPLHIAVLIAFVALEATKGLMIVALGLRANVPAFDPAGSQPLADLPAQVLLLHALNIRHGLTWNHPSWSISAEFWTYLIFAAMTLLMGHRRTLGLILLAGLSAWVLVTKSQHGIQATFDLGLPRCILGFAAGVFVYELRPWFERYARGAIGGCEWPMLILMVLFVSFADEGPLSFAAPVVFAAMVAIFSFEAGTVSARLQNHLCRQLGLWSYSIYMVHVLVLAAMMLAVAVVQKPLFKQEIFVVLPDGSRVAGVLNPLVYDGLLLIYIAAVLLVARFTYRVVEDPGRAFFARLANDLPGLRAKRVRLPDTSK
jgi:peptidoglycan/LPS O-acetylase OafA/YrhL